MTVVCAFPDSIFIGLFIWDFYYFVPISIILSFHLVLKTVQLYNMFVYFAMADDILAFEYFVYGY